MPWFQRATFTRRRLVLLGVGALFVLFLCIGSVLFFIALKPISHPVFATHLTSVLQENGFDSCKVGTVEVTVSKGMKIDSLTFSAQLDGRQRLYIRCKHLYLTYKPLYLLSQWRLLLTWKKSPRDNGQKVSGSDRADSMTTAAATSTFFATLDTVLFAAVTTLTCDEASIFIKRGNTTIGSVQRLKSIITIQSHQPTRYRATITADSLHYGFTQIRSFSTDFRLELPLVFIERYSCELYAGTIQGNAEFNVQRNRLHHLEGQARNIDIGTFYAYSPYGQAHPTRSTIQGNADMNFHFDSSFIDFDSLVGSGEIELRDVDASNLPFAKNLAAMTKIASLAHLRFSTVKADLRLAATTLHSDRIIGQGIPLSIDGSGSLSLQNRYLSVTTKGIIPLSYRDSIIPMVWHALYPEPDSTRSFTCTIFGPVASPSVSLDKSFMKHAVNSVLQELQNQFNSLKDLQQFLK